MRIIIDGYNVFHVAKQWGDVKNEQGFITRIIQYKKIRQHEIMLVFDGGTSLYETETYRNGIIIMYAGYAQNADIVIINRLKQEKHTQQLVVVTSDREIRDTAEFCGIASIDSESFYELLLRRISEAQKIKFFTKKHEYVKKLTTSENPMVDALLLQASLPMKDEDSDKQDRVSKKDQLSKENKIVLQIIEKL